MDSMIGRQFNNWIVLAFSHIGRCREKYYLCKCKCGKIKSVRGHSLRHGNSGQCQACSASKTRNRVTHDKSKTPVYCSWKGMIHRCMFPNDPNYKNYGGKGISVDILWQNFETFYDWSIQNGWEKGLTIDRINVDGNYTPGNCRWTTKKKQKENVHLLSSANKSGYRGVSWTKDKQKWLSRITVDYKIHHIGHFQNKDDAAKAYNKYVMSQGIKRPLNEVEARKEAHR